MGQWFQGQICLSHRRLPPFPRWRRAPFSQSASASSFQGSDVMWPQGSEVTKTWFPVEGCTIPLGRHVHQQKAQRTELWKRENGGVMRAEQAGKPLGSSRRARKVGENLGTRPFAVVASQQLRASLYLVLTVAPEVESPCPPHR